MLGQRRIALVVVSPQDILRVALRTVHDFQLALRSTACRADALRRKSRPASRLVGLLKQQNLCALFGRHQSRHQPAPPGADDNDTALDGV